MRLLQYCSIGITLEEFLQLFSIETLNPPPHKNIVCSCRLRLFQEGLINLSSIYSSPPTRSFRWWCVWNEGETWVGCEDYRRGERTIYCLFLQEEKVVKTLFHHRCEFGRVLKSSLKSRWYQRIPFFSFSVWISVNFSVFNIQNVLFLLLLLFSSSLDDLKDGMWELQVLRWC